MPNWTLSRPIKAMIVIWVVQSVICSRPGPASRAQQLVGKPRAPRAPVLRWHRLSTREGSPKQLTLWHLHSRDRNAPDPTQLSRRQNQRRSLQSGKTLVAADENSVHLIYFLTVLEFLISVLTDKKVFHGGMPDEISDAVLTLFSQGVATSSKKTKITTFVFLSQIFHISDFAGICSWYTTVWAFSSNNARGVGFSLFLSSYFDTTCTLKGFLLKDFFYSSIYAVSQYLFHGVLWYVGMYRFFKIVFLISVGSAVSGADKESLDLGSLQYSDPWINSCTLQQIIIIINTVLWNICAQRPLQKHI